MNKNKFKKDIKRNKKRLSKSKELLKEIELRPCKGDADMKQKDEEIKTLKHDIYKLEIETNQFILYFERGGSLKI